MVISSNSESAQVNEVLLGAEETTLKAAFMLASVTAVPGDLEYVHTPTQTHTNTHNYK